MEKKTKYWPVVIIGGGIVGSGILRDLSLHGIKTLLIDRSKVSSQTSKSSSKMLHGGIRYLENFDLALVKEALQERNLWLKIAPELCYQESFAIPVYKNSSRPLWMILVGIFLYHYLSGSFKNLIGFLSKNKLNTLFPQLKKTGLKGAGLYEDAVVDDELLTIKVVEDALRNPECEVWEDHALSSLRKISHNRFELDLKFPGGNISIICEDIIFATGPFTDYLLQQLNAFPWSPKLQLSKGSHLWLKKEALTLPNPIVLTPNDGRVIFVIPYPNKILVGTTEVPMDRPQADITPSQEEIDYLLGNINEYFTGTTVTKEDIIGAFSGIRPLVKDSSGSLGKTSRDHHIYQPENNAYVILGGKYTTFRVMASDIASRIVRKRNIPYKNYLTMQKLRSGKKDPTRPGDH